MADDLFSDVEPIPADPDADSHADVDFDAPDLGDERGDGNDPFTVISNDQIENADKLIADGQVQEALIQYRSAVRKANEKGEDDTEQRIDLGDAYVYSGQGLNAFRQYRRAIKTAPQRAEPHFAMGELYMYDGRLQPALFETGDFIGQGFESAARIGHFGWRYGRGQQRFQACFLGFDAGHAQLVLFQLAFERPGLRGQLLAFLCFQFALFGTAQSCAGLRR